MANEEYCHAGKPMYYNSAGLTAIQVLSRPAPPGPRSLHGGKSSVVQSLLVRTPSTLAFLGHPSHQGYPGHFRRKPPRGRHQPIPSIRGVLATPRRLTALADIAGLQLLWGPKGDRSPRVLYPRSRPSAWPPSQLVFQVSTSHLSWQCHILHCHSFWFAISCTPMAFMSQCPLQCCKRIQSRRR